MHINCFSVKFWFNIFNNHLEVLNDLSASLKTEFSNFQVNNESPNLFAPIIEGHNPHQNHLTFSKINLQYTKENVTMQDFKQFKETVFTLFDILSKYLNVAHSALYLNIEMDGEEFLKQITSKTLSSKFYDDDLIDVSLKLGKKKEDLFYKIVTVLNKKQLQIPEIYYDNGEMVPIPLISWYNSKISKEIIEVSYEINDKYSFDNTKDYQTTEFYLNKMLYILENEYESDIENILKKGKF